MMEKSDASTSITCKKAWVIPLLLMACLNFPVAAAEKVLLDATRDFSLSVQGFVPYLVDKGRKCLEVDASKHKDKFAAAEHTFKGQPSNYDLSLTVYVEADGESSFRLLVDGKAVGATFKNPRVPKARDHDKHVHTWKGVSLKTGSKIQIQSNSISNGLIKEGSGYAWARGKWLTLAMAPLTTSLSDRNADFRELAAPRVPIAEGLDARGRKATRSEEVMSNSPNTSGWTPIFHR